MPTRRSWRNRYAGDPQILGRSIAINGLPFTIIGIVPAEFQFLSPSHLWMPFSAGPPGAPYLRRARFLDVIGRLKPGVTLDVARAYMKAVAANIAAVSPDTNKGWTAIVEPMKESIVTDELELTSFVLVAVVACVLLIACANVAGLLMARGASRSREFAVRAALGAGRRRVRAQSLTESLLLSAVGGAAGLAVCAAILRAAGLLLRTLSALADADPGYRAENVLTMRVNLPTTQYNTSERMLSFYESVEREVNALPGVRSVGWGSALPLDGSFFGQIFEVVGAPPVDASNRPVATYQMISSRYLQTLGISLVRGRGFDDRDVSGAMQVCVVNEEFARRYLPGRDPIGA